MWKHRPTSVRFIFVCSAFTIGILVWRLAFLRDPQPEPLLARTQLVKRLTNETAIESARNLARFDDALWAAASIGESPDEPTSYNYLRVYLPSLSRVRKLLQLPESERGEITPILREQLRNALDGYDSAEKALRAQMGNALRQNRMHVESEDAPSRYSEFLVSGPASAYLLALFGDEASLPIMLQGYQRQSALPMDRQFLFYSMHLIALGQPRDGLTKDALAALDAYVAEAASLPSPEQLRCAGWDDEFDHTDFRASLFGVPLPSDPAREFTLFAYPAQHGGDARPQWGNALDLDSLVKRLERFVSLAHGP